MLMIGVAVSSLPIVLRILLPHHRDAETMKRNPHDWVTVAGLVPFAAAVAVIVSIP
jgi:hypothetical protein